MIDYYNVASRYCTPHPGGGAKLVVEMYHKPKGIAAIKQPPTTEPFTISCALGSELPTTIPSNVIVGKLRQYMGGELLELGYSVYNARAKKGYISEELKRAAAEALHSLMLTTYCMLESNDADEEYIAKAQEIGRRADTLRRNVYSGVINE